MTLALLLLSVLVAQGGAITIKRENSLIGPFKGDLESLLFWDIRGDTELNPNFIRLTPDEPERRGALWNNFPCMSNNWELQTHFRIHGKGVYLNGDGMAIWYAKDPSESGPVFGYKDHFSGLGVFIDTAKESEGEPHKHRHPYISAVVNNGSFIYKHDEDGTHGQIGGCHVPLRNLDVPTKIAISYMGSTLSVYLDVEGLGQWRPCLRAIGVTLPTGYHFGITASTSESSDIHDIFSATALNLDPADKAWEDKSEITPHAEFLEVPFKDGVGDHVVEDSREVKKPVVEEEDFDDEEEESDAGKPQPDTGKPQTDTRKPEPQTETTEEPSSSFFSKLLYFLGASIVLYISISIYRRWSERRRERMQKRLF